MKFDIAFRMGNQTGKYSRYSLRQLCVFIVDRYSLTEKELEQIVTLPIVKKGSAELFKNEDLVIRRVG